MHPSSTLVLVARRWPTPSRDSLHLPARAQLPVSTHTVPVLSSNPVPHTESRLFLDTGAFCSHESHSSSGDRNRLMYPCWFSCTPCADCPSRFAAVKVVTDDPSRATPLAPTISEGGRLPPSKFSASKRCMWPDSRERRRGGGAP